MNRRWRWLGGVLCLWGLWSGRVWAGCPRPAAFVQSYQYDARRGASRLLSYRAGPVYRPRRTYAGQSKTWRQAMKDIGRQLDRHQVRMVYLIHGTFMGKDGLGLGRFLKMLFPSLSKGRLDALQRQAKPIFDVLAGDVGNFTDVYLALLEQALQARLLVQPFRWSSENHHIARLQAAWELALRIHMDLSGKSLATSERILLFGHSHAGQVFALLQHLRKPSPLAPHLWRALDRLWRVQKRDVAIERKRLQQALVSLRRGHLDIVAAGTPVRYRWVKRKGDKLLHLINHRPLSRFRRKAKTGMAGAFDGVFTTRDGDYVQQIGITGSDFLASTPQMNAINRSLAPFLGYDRTPGCLAKLLDTRIRRHQTGQHLLIDYKDTRFLPNMFSTLFGHGIYTTVRSMHFHFALVAKQWYAGPPSRPVPGAKGKPGKSKAKAAKAPTFWSLP